LGGGNGFVWQILVGQVLDGQVRAEGFEAVEILEGAAVLALGLSLVAEEERPGVGLGGEAEEAGGEEVVAVLGAGDFDIAIAGEGLVHGEEGLIVADAEGFVEAGGEEAAFEAGGAEDGLLGEGHALQGEELLGVDGLVGGDEVGFEVSDFLKVFEADDAEGRRGEAVLDGVTGGAGLALGGFGAGGMGGVGAIGGEPFGGGGFTG
jgi:hypothetical protein